MDLATARAVERAARWRFWRDIALILLAGAVAFAVFVALVRALAWNSPGNQFVRKYFQLEIEMSEADVNGLFGKSPEYSCTFKSYRICYYFAPGPFGGTRDPDLSDLPKGEVSSSAEVPYIYAAAQVAFDEHGKVFAFTRNGETNTIVTKRGEVGGCCFSQLDEKFFDGSGLLGDVPP